MGSQMGSLEGVRLAEKSEDVFLRCVHVLEFRDWLIKLDN